MPEHVHSLLRACPDCEKQLPCAFFQGLVKQSAEESEIDSDDSAYTSGLGSDDSGLSDVAPGAKKSKGHEKKAEGKDKATKSVGQDSKKAKGIVPKETVKGNEKPKDGGSKDPGKS